MKVKVIMKMKVIRKKNLRMEHKIPDSSESESYHENESDQEKKLSMEQKIPGSSESESYHENESESDQEKKTKHGT